MIDRYEIRHKIGQGGVGAVYHAFDTKLQRNVAIKRMLPLKESRAQTDAAAGLKKEASIISSLQNPNIITVYDAGIDDEGAFVVMELIEGQTLDQIVRSAALRLDDFIQVVEQSLGGLIAAQSVGLLHRDLKPKNIMVAWLPSGNFRLKILDFGLAKFSAQPSFQTVDHSDNILGSIHFMAPEQFERLALDYRTDIYAMGCVYYFALTQKYPFGGENPAEVMNSHLNHQVKALHETRADLGQGYCDWVMRLISRQPGDRPPDARAALREFQEIDPMAGPIPARKGATAPIAPLIPKVGAAPKVITSPTGPITASERARKATGGAGSTTGTNARPPTGTTRPAAAPKQPPHWTRKPPRALLYVAFVFVPAMALLVAVSVHKNRDSDRPFIDSASREKPSLIPSLPLNAHRVAHFAAHAGAFEGNSYKDAVEHDRVGRWEDLADTVLGNNQLTHPNSDRDSMPSLELAGPQSGLNQSHPVLRFRKGDELSVVREGRESAFNDAFDGDQFTWFILFQPAADAESHLVAALDQQDFPNSLVTWYRPPNYASGVRRAEPVGALSESPCELGGFILLTFVWDGVRDEQFQSFTTSGNKRVPGSIEKVNASGVAIRRFRIGSISRPNSRANNLFAGDVAEFIIYNKALETRDIKTIESYLTRKYFGV